MERLHKYLAQAGACSRREAEALIRAGRVSVNNQVIREMGVQIDPLSAVVTLDGREIRPRGKMVYLMLYKPPRVMTTLSDPGKRVKVSDLLKEIDARVYPVGRLDYLSEGLLLLTNDGELAYRLTHPKFKVDKTYQAWVKGTVGETPLKELRRGVMLEDGLTAPARVKRLDAKAGRTLLEITIHEGRNRQVRRMCEKVGHPVLTLKRTRYGPLALGNLLPGRFRHLKEEEIYALKSCVGLIKTI